MSEYLIAHIGHTRKDCEHITWWNPDSKGYTVCIDKAGLYTEAKARSICSIGTCVAVPKSVAAELARTTPYYRRADGTLNKLYDGGPHSVVPNELKAWKVILAGRLSGCGHPEKPTPIGAKARAIYLDGILMKGGAQ
jgi:hypothetical protein